MQLCGSDGVPRSIPLLPLQTGPLFGLLGKGRPATTLATDRSDGTVIVVIIIIIVVVILRAPSLGRLGCHSLLCILLLLLQHLHGCSLLGMLQKAPGGVVCTTHDVGAVSHVLLVLHCSLLLYGLLLHGLLLHGLLLHVLLLHCLSLHCLSLHDLLLHGLLLHGLLLHGLLLHGLLLLRILLLLLGMLLGMLWLLCIGVGRMLHAIARVDSGRTRVGVPLGSMFRGLPPVGQCRCLGDPEEIATVAKLHFSTSNCVVSAPKHGSTCTTNPHTPVATHPSGTTGRCWGWPFGVAP